MNILRIISADVWFSPWESPRKTINIHGGNSPHLHLCWFILGYPAMDIID